MGKIIPLLGIDAHRATDRQKTGTEHYSFQIIQELLKINSLFKIRLYSDKPIKGFTGNFDHRVIHFPRLWSQVRLAVEMIVHRPNLLFVPAHTIPIIHPRTVVTLHDLGFKYFPELYDPTELWYHNWSMNYAARHANHIIAVSEYTKEDLIKNYRIAPDRITVIYHGWNRMLYHPPDNTEKAKNKQLYERYLYYLGRLERKKNYLQLLKSFVELKKLYPDLKLVVSGKPGVGYEETRKFINQIDPKIRHDIIELGYTPDDQVAKLMREALVFVFPSQFEGFGLPLIEAMASGTPVVATKLTSIPEIAKGAGLLVKSAEPVNLVPAIKKLIDNSKLRNDLIQHGLKRANDFSWEKAGKQTMEVLVKTLNEQ